MSHLIEVAFKGNRKEFFLWDGDDPPRTRAAVIVEGDRGEDLGRVHATGESAEQRFAGVAHGAALLGGPNVQPGKRALRLATADDEERVAELTEQNEQARRKAIERVKAHGLVMKVTDAEWQWDRRKLTLYFTAEKRVDFRGLVRDLAALFRTRIELKQIGVRDEAKRLDGVGRCGREYCSSSWLPELRPVNLSVAKDQHLSLNPTQISGACGRLMCSLRYEHEFYVQARKRFPKEGKVLATSRGEEKVLANDIFRDRVTLRGTDGETRVVALADLRRELSGEADEPRDGVTAIVVEERVAAESEDDAPPTEDRRRADRRRPSVDQDAAATQLRPRAPALEAAAPDTLPSPAPTLPSATPSPTSNPAPNAPPTRIAAAGPPVVAPEPAEDAALDVHDDDGDEPGDGAERPGDSDAGDAGDAPTRPRRRRGRRGGRRGRSGGTSGAGAGPGPDAPAPDAPADDA